MPHELLTVNEVAETFRVSVSTVNRWRQRGTLPAVKVGGALRFRRSDIEAMIERQEAAS